MNININYEVSIVESAVLVYGKSAGFWGDPNVKTAIERKLKDIFDQFSGNLCRIFEMGLTKLVTTFSKDKLQFALSLLSLLEKISIHWNVRTRLLED